MHKVLEQGSEILMMLLIMTPLMITFYSFFMKMHEIGGGLWN